MISSAPLQLKTIIWDYLRTAYQRNIRPKILSFILLFYLQGCILSPCMLPFCFSHLLWLVGWYWWIFFLQPGRESPSAKAWYRQSTTCCPITELTNTHTIFLVAVSCSRNHSTCTEICGGFRLVVLLCRMLWT